MNARVLAMVTDAYGATGGIAQYNRDLLEALAGAPGISEVLLLSRTPAPGAVAPAAVTQLAAQRGKLPYSLGALRAAATHGPVDVVLCGHLFAAPLAAAVARLAGARLWLQLYGIEAWQRPSPTLRWAAEQAHLVTCISRYTRRRFLQWARCEPEAVRVLPTTVDAVFTPGPKDAAWLDRMGLTGRRVLLTVARLAAAERYKGHDLVLRALARLLPFHPDLAYVIAGDGDDRPRLEQLAASLGVQAHVRFLGYVPDALLPTLYRSSDLFVMPSTGEGFGIVFLQAQACGLPVVAGDGDGARDPLLDGAAGMLVPAAEAALAEAIAHSLAAARRPESPEAFAKASFQPQVAALLARLLPGGPA